MAAPTGTRIRVGLQASEKNQKATDELDITLFSSRPDSSTRSEAFKIEQSLAATATRDGLTKRPLLCREGICFHYLKSGVPILTVYIHLRPKPAQTSAGVADQSPGPKLAIILDDLGSDRGAAEAVFALHYPLTISVLPNHVHSADIAKEAHRRGLEVMLHLPMQSLGSEKAETQELRPGMTASEVATALDQMLQAVPNAVGVNNHQGSQATADQALMSELMPALRDRGLFYIDSRTTAATVAFDTAREVGVPAAFRNVPFLDDVPEVGAVRKQLALALAEAREKGEAVAIGHPHPATLQALRQLLPVADSQGVRLVLVSELVH